MNVGSLFSGVGGLDLGLHRAGFAHAFFCESDEWRREVLRARWPGVPIYDDVRRVADESPSGRRQRLGTDPASKPQPAPWWKRGADGLDLLCGGFPCQDVSVAGQRRGLAGARSGLFYEFARIIDAVRPGWVLVENVPGLLSSNGGRDFGAVVGTLADLGYGLGWRVVDSRFFGVPQRRRRVFIVGALAVGDPRAAADRAGQVLAVGTRCGRHPAARGEAGPDIAYALADGSGARTGSGRDGQDDDVNLIAFHPTGGGAKDLSPTENLTPGTGTGRGGAVAIMTPASVRRLTPRECERLQGFPDDWTQLGGTPDSRRYAALGDAVTVNVAEWIGGHLLAAGPEVADVDG